MKIFSRVILTASLCLLLFAATAFSQEDLYELGEKIVKLYQQGRYEEATEFAKKVLKKAEEIKEVEKVAPFIKVDEETLAAIKKEADSLLQHMDMSAEVSLSQDDADRIHITGADDELLIGPEGKTLDSLQYQLRKIDSRMLGEKLALNIDAGDYRQRRSEELIAKARELAQQAIETGKTHAIPSLNPQERRVVHMAIRDNKMIRTKSIGNGLFKKVLIFPRDQKPPSKPRRGRQGGRRTQRS